MSEPMFWNSSIIVPTSKMKIIDIFRHRSCINWFKFWNIVQNEPNSFSRVTIQGVIPTTWR